MDQVRPSPGKYHARKKLGENFENTKVAGRMGVLTRKQSLYLLRMCVT
jgi:hypothetical protein